MSTVAVRSDSLRRLARTDLDAVVAMDASALHRSRRPYFERRLAAALRAPARHVQFALDDGDALAGYVLARMLEGEFGRGRRALVIEALGAGEVARSHGVLSRLLAALVDDARRLGIPEIRTEAAWNDHTRVRWLDDSGFTLAANHIVDCALPGAAQVAEREDAHVDGEDASHEVRYGNDDRAPRLYRDAMTIASLQPSDLDAVVRIDEAITGTRRVDYMQRMLAEAMHDSAIRVSLTARLDGGIAGFLTARVDIGDFGRVEPVAVLDTIGVHPEFRNRHVAHALLSQLFVNLAALRIERVETTVAPHDLALLGFLYDVGFGPSQRLSFVRGVA